jgi:hypothetical protein
LADDGGFEIGLGITAALIETEELQNQQFLKEVARVGNDLAFLREPADAAFVTAQSESLVEAGVELAFQLADCPVLFAGFDFVEAALVGVFDAEEESKRWLVIEIPQ